MAHNKSHKYINKMEKKEKQPNPDKMFRKQVKEEMDRKGIKGFSARQRYMRERMARYKKDWEEGSWE